MKRYLLSVGIAGVFLAVVAVQMACGSGDPSLRADAGIAPEPGYRVRGIARGVLTPVSLRLVHGDDVDLVIVDADGPFEFPGELDVGAAYAAELVDELPCVMEGATGTIEGDDVEILLTCDGVASLTNLVLSGPSAPELGFSPTQLSYTAEVSLLQPAISVTATAASAEAIITMAGTPLASGSISAPMQLLPGDNEIEITVTHPLEWTRTYHVTVQRTARVAQYSYAKPDNTGRGDYFGYSVAVSGDTLAVGAYLEDSSATGVDGEGGNNGSEGSGAVYIFRRNGKIWEQEAYLKASNTGQRDFFGYSLSLSGDTLAVGAYFEDSSATGANGEEGDDGAQDSGAVYVFQRTGTVWAQQAYLKASNTDAEDYFGYSVSLSGDTLAVGAWGEDSVAQGVGGEEGDDSAQDSGAVYVFQRTGTVWAQQAYLKASNTDAGDNLGLSVSLSGDTLAVGAWGEDSAAQGVGDEEGDNTAQDSGAVYVFQRTGTVWAQQAYLKASNTDAEDYFGYSVALSGDTLAVGAWGEDSVAQGVGGEQEDDAAQSSGAAYVFRRSEGSWEQEAYLKASNAGEGDELGISVALSGDALVVGAWEEDGAAKGVDGDGGSDGAPESGAAYLFMRSGEEWTEKSYMKGENTEGDDWFGWAVAISAETIAVGAMGEDSNAIGIGGDEESNDSVNSGAVYIFH